MDEIALLKEIGSTWHLRIVADALLVSFLAKLIYSEHIQRLVADLRRGVGAAQNALAETIRPSLYESMSPTGRRIVDIIEAAWSFLVALVSFGSSILLFLALMSLSSKSNTIEQFSGLIVLLFIAIYLSMAAIANGIRAWRRIRES